LRNAAADSEKPQTASVIIVNYNGGPLLQIALDHLKKQTLPAHEVFIIDNASSDGSAEGLDLSRLPGARVIALEKNVGFAAANNHAAKLATGEWLALLNPDTEPEPDWLEALLEATERHPDTTMFASAQLDAVDPGTLDGAGDCYFFLGIPWRGGFGRKASEMPQEGECFSPCGASALFRRDIYLDAGGLDESYFCYCEDIDLAFRLRLRGEKCIFVPSAVVKHHGSAITGRYSDFTVRLGTRNRIRTYLTSMPPLALAMTLPGHMLATVYLYLRTLRKPHIGAMRQGIGEALQMLPTIWKRRREVQRTRKCSSADLLAIMSWNPATLHARKCDVRPLRVTVTARKRECYDRPRS